MAEKHGGISTNPGESIHRQIRRDHPGIAEFDELAKRKENEGHWLTGKVATHVGEALDLYPWQGRLTAEQKDFLVRAVLFEMESDHDEKTLAKRAFGHESSEAAKTEAEEQLNKIIQKKVRRIASKPEYGPQMPGPAVVLTEE